MKWYLIYNEKHKTMREETEEGNENGNISLAEPACENVLYIPNKLQIQWDLYQNFNDNLH